MMVMVMIMMMMLMMPKRRSWRMMAALGTPRTRNRETKELMKNRILGARMEGEVVSRQDMTLTRCVTKTGTTQM